MSSITRGRAIDVVRWTPIVRAATAGRSDRGVGVASIVRAAAGSHERGVTVSVSGERTAEIDDERVPKLCWGLWELFGKATIPERDESCNKQPSRDGPTPAYRPGAMSAQGAGEATATHEAGEATTAHGPGEEDMLG